MASVSLMSTKDGRQFYKIAISRGYGKTPYTKRWYPPNGWRKSAIESKLRTVISEFEDECARRSENHLLLKEYAVRFMQEIEAECSENTRASFQGNLDNHILPAFVDADVSSITSAQITEFLQSLQKTKLSYASIIKIYTVLRSMFNHAKADGVINSNPMVDVQRPKQSKIVSQPPPSYTEKEMLLIIEAISHETLMWQCYLWLLVDTGCRRGEILALQWSDIDFGTGIISVRHNLCYTPQKGIFLDSTKNGKSRDICIDEDIVKLLIKLKSQSISEFLFTQKDGIKPMHPCTPTAHLKDMQGKYGIDDFHPHKLRHTFASIAITNGADIASVSEKLGHADKATTLRMYTHANLESQKKANSIYRQVLKY